MRRRSLFRAASLLPPLLLAPAARAAWELAPLATDEAGARAVAIAADGRMAAGDGRGVWLVEASGAARRLDLAGARDLAFAPDGALWIASEAGLQRASGERTVERSPAPGELARDVRRVDANRDGVAVATAAGVFFSTDGVRFARIEVPVGEAGALGIALSAEPDGAALWIATERGLFRAALEDSTRAERVALPVDLRPALDVAVTDDGGVLALGRQWLALRGRDGSFRASRLALPPGATPLRVAAASNGVWIATDRGVVTAPAAAELFERADDPAGTAIASDVAALGDRVFVATSRGVLVATSAPDTSRPAPGAAAIGCDPPIRAVQRAALEHLRLAGDPAAAMRRGVRVRGYLPLVTLEASKSRDEGERSARDEAYISGGYRRLYDADRARERDEAVALQLTWDLGDAAYHPEQIDVSTEARRLIELRDDVLDELNQLYFDRQRALAVASADSPDAARERLRAAELAAGLDAWTDGWFGRVARCAGSPPSPPR